MKNVGGRPTIYTPDLGEKILALMVEGYSLAASAASLGIHRQRVYDWSDKYPDFKEIVELAKGNRQFFLERRLLTSDSSAIVSSTIFALKNASPDDWRDKQEVDHTGSMQIVISSDDSKL